MILGIESTAHTFGVGIISGEGRIYANCKRSYSSSKIGMIPNEIAEHHRKIAQEVCEEAFSVSGISWNEITGISYSAGPGIDPVLWEGYHFAKGLSEKYVLPLIPVCHSAAHLNIGKLLHGLKNPVYLYVSGVNTQIIHHEHGYHIYGETLDIGLGNMLDKMGRLLGFGFPAGPEVEKIATSGSYIELPYCVKGMDVSFSGILTKVKQIKDKHRVEDLCYSVQETCFAMLAEVAERAMALLGVKELLLVGGVGANKRLCNMLDIMCRARNAKFFSVPIELAVDNAAMIAWEGWLRRNDQLKMTVNAHWRIDEIAKNFNSSDS